MNSLETFTFLGNTGSDYLYALVSVAVALVVFKAVQWIILHQLEKLAKHTKTDIDDTVVEILKMFKPPFYLYVAVYVGLQLLTFSEFVMKILTGILVVWIAYYVVIALQKLIDAVVAKASIREEWDAGTQTAYRYIGRIAKWALWIVAVVLVLGNLGIEITALVAGLGVGGIAIAFALQKILGDLFSSFAIYFDRPFVEGDFIVVGSDMGVVKKIGIKTTRIQALQGEEIVISNQELTSVRVQNFKKLEERRVVSTVGVAYDTPQDKMKDILVIVQKVFSKIQDVRLDRVHFKTFADSALLYEIVYFVISSDYNVYMDIQQEFGFALKKAFDESGIEFAYPTQTIYVKKS